MCIHILYYLIIPNVVVHLKNQINSKTYYPTFTNRNDCININSKENQSVVRSYKKFTQVILDHIIRFQLRKPDLPKSISPVWRKLKQATDTIKIRSKDTSTITAHVKEKQQKIRLLRNLRGGGDLKIILRSTCI